MRRQQLADQAHPPRNTETEGGSRGGSSNGASTKSAEQVPPQSSSGSLGANNRSYSEEQERGAKKILQLAKKSHYDVHPHPAALL